MLVPSPLRLPHSRTHTLTHSLTHSHTHNSALIIMGFLSKAVRLGLLLDVGSLFVFYEC